MNSRVKRVAAALSHGQRVRRLRLEQLQNNEVFRDPAQALIASRREAIGRVDERLKATLPKLVDARRHRLEAIDASLRAMDPVAVLDRGYAIVRQSGGIVGGIADIEKNLPVRVCFADGALEADIRNLEPKENKP